MDLYFSSLFSHKKVGKNTFWKAESIALSLPAPAPPIKKPFFYCLSVCTLLCPWKAGHQIDPYPTNSKTLKKPLQVSKSSGTVFFFHTLLCAGVGGQIRRLLGVACWLGEQQTKCPLHPSVTSLRSSKATPPTRPTCCFPQTFILSPLFFPSTILHKHPGTCPHKNGGKAPKNF